MWLFGLETSKFDWAITEKELQDHRDLQDAALDDQTYGQKVRSWRKMLASGFVLDDISVRSTRKSFILII